MTQRDDGGSAFPSTPLGDDGKPGGAHRFGMSLRDWFAGQALSSIPLRSWDYLSSGDDKVKAWATLAYAVADAMLAARSPAPEGGPQSDSRDELLREAVQVIRGFQGALDNLWCNYLELAVGGPAAWDEYGAPASGSGLDTLAKIQKELGDE